MSQFIRSLENRLEDAEFRAGYEGSQQRRQLIADLTRWRRNAKLTQDAVAARLGVGQPMVSQFESSDDPRMSTIQRYARAVGASVHAIVVPEDPQICGNHQSIQPPHDA